MAKVYQSMVSIELHDSEANVLTSTASAISTGILLSGVQSSGGSGVDGHANKWEEERAGSKWKGGNVVRCR